jgi:hypothetical protein
MTTIDPGSTARAPLIQRIKNIIVAPRAEWPRIAAEPETIGSLYINYIMPVAGFAVLCSFIDNLLGVTILGVTYKPTYGQAVMSAVWQYGMQLGGVLIMALVLGYLAPKFGGRNNRLNALKLAGYAATAGWLSNVFLLIPWLGVLTLLGLYSFYLITTGRQRCSPCRRTRHCRSPPRSLPSASLYRCWCSGCWPPLARAVGAVCGPMRKGSGWRSAATSTSGIT